MLRGEKLFCAITSTVKIDFAHHSIYYGEGKKTAPVTLDRAASNARPTPRENLFPMKLAQPY